MARPAQGVPSWTQRPDPVAVAEVAAARSRRAAKSAVVAPFGTFGSRARPCPKARAAAGQALREPRPAKAGAKCRFPRNLARSADAPCQQSPAGEGIRAVPKDTCARARQFAANARWFGMLDQPRVKRTPIRRQRVQSPARRSRPRGAGGTLLWVNRRACQHGYVKSKCPKFRLGSFWSLISPRPVREAGIC